MGTPRPHAERDLYQEVTDRIVTALEQGVAPWVPGHTTGAGPLGVFPRNGLTGRPYAGVNVLLLWLTATERGHRSADWYTFNQACAAVGLARDARGRWVPEPGKGVRKGERATPVTFWKTLTVEDRETGEDRTVPLLRHFSVFNRAQIDGLPADTADVEPAPPAWERLAAAERLVGASGAHVVEGGAPPAYRPATDSVHMPPLGAYRTREGYYVDLLHELTHWTGHPSRLARDLSGRFGSPIYAREELAAEMGSAFLCATLGITGKLQHPEYVASWLRVLREDKRAVFHAASQARQACEYLTDFMGSPVDGGPAAAAATPAHPFAHDQPTEEE